MVQPLLVEDRRFRAQHSISLNFSGILVKLIQMLAKRIFGLIQLVFLNPIRTMISSAFMEYAQTRGRFSHQLKGTRYEVNELKDLAIHQVLRWISSLEDV
ncbi:uncharacterized protein [Gossypium hirsutum]|uniref:Uncharacterized protein isoform X2 n=1 Tax=Gossypium hirsutum TaxID=3635 RepID=A0A1U8IRA0_GOSHI|nr:uncharacterized protein LOC107897448 isoform X2 [Gossypium hirsutum]